MKPAPHCPLVTHCDVFGDHVRRRQINYASRVRSAGAALRITLAGLGIGVVASGAFAATATTWTGAANSTFNNNANWTNGILTTSSSSGSFATFSTLTTNQPNLANSQGLNGFEMTTASGGWTLGSGAGVKLTLGGGGMRSIGQSSGINTINVSTIELSSNQTWSAGTGGSLTVNSALTNITGVGDLTIGTITTGEGTLTLNGSSTRDRGTSLIAGTLLLGNDTALGASTTRLTVTGGGSTVALGSSGGTRNIANLMTLNSDLAIVGSDQMNFSGSFLINNKKLTVNNDGAVVLSHANGIGGTGGFTVGTGTGTLVISGGTNTNTGTVVLDGKLQLGNAGATGALNAASAVTLNSGGELSFDRTDAALNVANVISGSGAVRQKGSGTTTISGNNSAFTGTTTVAAGTLVVGHVNALGGAGGGVVTVSSGATLTSSVGLAFSNNVINRGTINSGGNAVTFATGKTLEGAGVFSGGGSFTVNGTLTHGDAPATTTIDSTAMTLGSSSTTVWSLGALTDNGTGTAGTDWSTFALQGGGSLTLQSGATLQVALDGIAFDGSQTYWQTAHSYALFSNSVTGSFVLTNNVFSDANGTGTFSVSGNNLNYVFSAAAIPEPSTMAFVMAAGAGMILLRARRRRSDIS